MFDLSFWEIVIIIIACVLFLKPEDLPVILRKTGQFIGKMKRMIDETISAIKAEEKPKTTKILGQDGKYYDAYDVKEVFKDIEQK